MNTKQQMKRWLLSAALTVAAASAAAPTFAAPPQARDREVEVRMADLPRSLRESINKERDGRDIKSIQHVFRNGNEWYRVTIDGRGSTEKIVRITERGEVLSEDKVRERDEDSRDYEREVKFSSLPREVKETIDQERGRHDLKFVFEVRRDGRKFYRAIIDERRGDRMIRVGPEGRLIEDRDIKDVRRGVDDDGDRVDFDRLPGAVRSTVAREAGSDTIADVYRYERRGFDVFEADLRSQTGRVRSIRVLETGKLVSEQDETPEGRRLVRFEDLPGAVKAGLASNVNPREVDRIVQVTHKGTTVYRAHVSRGGGAGFWVTVDDTGKAMREYDRRR